MTEYRIEFAIQRKRDEDEDFVEVGFGSSGTWDDIDSAEHAMGSLISCREWENYPTQPKAEDLEATDAE